MPLALGLCAPAEVTAVTQLFQSQENRLVIAFAILDLPITSRFPTVHRVLACVIGAGQVGGRVQLIPSSRAE
jgi:hypothetical protein